MKVELLTTEAGLRRVEPAWADLAGAVGAPITAQPLWCLPWWRHLGRGRPLMAIASSGGSLVALGPLQERRIAGLPVVRLLGHGLGAVSEMLVAPGHEDAAEAAWAAVLAGGWRHLDLREYRAGTSGLAALQWASSTTRMVPSDACRSLRLRGRPGDYLAARPKGLRRTLRRADERLAETGSEHAVEVVADGARLDQVLGEVVAVHDRAEADNPRQHLLRPPWASFTRALLSAAAASGRLRLFVGRIDGRAVSFDLGIVSGGRLEVWLGRFDPAHRALAPGHLSIRSIVAHGFAAGLDEVDLGLGDDRYKRLWCDQRSETLWVTAGSSVPVAHLGRRLLAVGAQARRLQGGVEVALRRWAQADAHDRVRGRGRRVTPVTDPAAGRRARPDRAGRPPG